MSSVGRKKSGLPLERVIHHTQVRYASHVCELDAARGVGFVQVPLELKQRTSQKRLAFDLSPLTRLSLATVVSFGVRALSSGMWAFDVCEVGHSVQLPAAKRKTSLSKGARWVWQYWRPESETLPALATRLWEQSEEYENDEEQRASERRPIAGFNYASGISDVAFELGALELNSGQFVDIPPNGSALIDSADTGRELQVPLQTNDTLAVCKQTDDVGIGYVMPGLNELKELTAKVQLPMRRVYLNGSGKRVMWQPTDGGSLLGHGTWERVRMDSVLTQLIARMEAGGPPLDYCEYRLTKTDSTNAVVVHRATAQLLTVTRLALNRSEIAEDEATIFGTKVLKDRFAQMQDSDTDTNESTDDSDSSQSSQLSSSSSPEFPLWQCYDERLRKYEDLPCAISRKLEQMPKRAAVALAVWSDAEPRAKDYVFVRVDKGNALRVAKRRKDPCHVRRAKSERQRIAGKSQRRVSGRRMLLWMADCFEPLKRKRSHSGSERMTDARLVESSDSESEESESASVESHKATAGGRVVSKKEETKRSPSEASSVVSLLEESRSAALSKISKSPGAVVGGGSKGARVTVVMPTLLEAKRKFATAMRTLHIRKIAHVKEFWEGKRKRFVVAEFVGNWRTVEFVYFSHCDADSVDLAAASGTLTIMHRSRSPLGYGIHLFLHPALCSEVFDGRQPCDQRTTFLCLLGHSGKGTVAIGQHNIEFVVKEPAQVLLLYAFHYYVAVKKERKH